MILSENYLRSIIKSILIENEKVKTLEENEDFKLVVEFIEKFKELKKQKKSNEEIKNELKPLWKKSGPAYRKLRMKVQMYRGYGKNEPGAKDADKLEKILDLWYKIFDELDIAPSLEGFYR